MKYNYISYTDMGGRKNNEDSLLVKETEKGLLLVVADGLGGHKSGEIASGTAIEEIEKHFTQEDRFDLEKAVQSANVKVIERQDSAGLRMQTTIAAAWIDKEVTQFAHVGDSRIYAFAKNRIVFQSKDHSVTQLAVAMGEIDASQIRQHEDRNLLTRALGSSDNVKIALSSIKNDEYEALLLCTDGFWEYILESEMCEQLAVSRNAEEWLDNMRKILSERISGDNDNNTAIAVIK